MSHKTRIRKGFVVGIKPDMVETYKRLHAAPWPAVLAALKAANIENYSIFLREPQNLLFGVYDYIGDNHAADMKKISEDEVTQLWWKETAPCQIPFADLLSGEVWAPMEEVFYLE